LVFYENILTGSLPNPERTTVDLMSPPNFVSSSHPSAEFFCYLEICMINFLLFLSGGGFLSGGTSFVSDFLIIFIEIDGTCGDLFSLEI